MLNDGHQGGTKYICHRGETPKINATKKSKKITVLGLTNLRGEAIMCVIIIKGKERNVFIESGVDPFHPLYDTYKGNIANSNYLKTTMVLEGCFLVAQPVNLKGKQYHQ